MNAELVRLKEKLQKESEQKAMDLMPYLVIFNPMIDEVTTEEAYQIFGSRKKFDLHRQMGHIHPIRGFGKKSRKFWSRMEIYSLKKSERINLELA